MRLNHLVVGDLTAAERIVFHIAGELTHQVLPLVDVGGESQGQLPFPQREWQLVLAAVDDCAGEHDFSFVVEAIPAVLPMELDSVEWLRGRLFALLSFLAGREVGIGPAVGLEAAGHVRWAEWASPRLRLGTPGVRWCPEHLVVDALPVLADGFCRLDDDSDLERVVNRAVQHMLAANSSEALDVRIPVACSGIELLAWGVLQRHRWLDSTALKALSAGAVVRLLLRWAGIPAEVPEGFDALAARRTRIGRADWAGPDIVFSVRNALVHPPKRLDVPEWPDKKQLFEAWQLATWYLELAIARVLGYHAEYWSRLRLGRQQWDTEPVPWATEHATPALRARPRRDNQ